MNRVLRCRGSCDVKITQPKARLSNHHSRMPICHHFPPAYSTSPWGVFLSLYADNGFSSGHGKNAGIMFAIIAYCPHRKSRHLDESRPPRIRELSPFFETKVTVTDEIIVQCLMAIQDPECGCLGKVTNYQEIYGIARCATRYVH